MNPDRWRAVGELFDGALAVTTNERQQWLDSASNGDEELRHEVLSLLASHDATPGGFVQDRIQKVLVSFYETKATPAHPLRVGPYRLVRELGSGGMGTVFLAERDDDQYHAQVAIKLVRPGMDTEFILARFRRERQTLARLQHPNIARLLDGGTTENGLPYIVMDYIDGPSITQYASQNRLSIPQKLRLFIDVCSAVEYAHRNFVIHRDVKPGNILVGRDGIPKLLDFGICKLLYDDVHTHTETVGSMLTPAYASPEQVRGEGATALSDVYSLGVVLYELLSGKLPSRYKEETSQSGARRLRETQVPAPSAAVGEHSLSRQLSGDLDNVVMRTLEADPEHRYQSAEHISDDLRRYLANEPVQARPQSAGYRAWKFVRRNAVKVAGVSGVIVALAIGLGVSLHEAHVAQARLEKIQSLSRATGQVAPNEVPVDVYQSLVDQQTGDSLAASGQLASAAQSYTQSANSAELCMKRGQPVCLGLYIESNQRLARNAVALGHREEALQFAQRALTAGENPPSGTSQSSALPRAFGAMGLTYAALWQGPLGQADDRQQAQAWLKKSLDAWRSSQSASPSSINQQREMKEVQEVLDSTTAEKRR